MAGKMFKYKRGIKVPYAEQGYIYFTSLNFYKLSAEKQTLILKLCKEVGKEYEPALFEFVTTTANATYITSKHYISKATLYRLVKRYYEKFPSAKMKAK